MEIKQLYPFALLVVIVSMVIGAGVLALDKFGVSVKEEATVVNESKKGKESLQSIGEEPQKECCIKRSF